LLPKFGGKGMYGMNVHQAVCAAKEKETGITIHHVNEKFDEGEIIFQKKIFLDENDSPEKILKKIRKLELEFYPKVIEKMLA
jgi:phosphoribosylglycinamide formyltransferase-1